MRRKAVIPTVPGEECHRTVTDPAYRHPVTRPAERRLDLDLERVVEQCVETGATDYADLSARSVDHGTAGDQGRLPGVEPDSVGLELTAR